MKTTRKLLPLLSAVALSSFAGAAAAQATDMNAWQIEATPYVWAAGIKGEAGIHGVKAELDESFSDIMETLKVGLMGLVTARKGQWGFAFEGFHIRQDHEIKHSVKTPSGISVNGELDATNTLSIAQASALYRVVDDKTKVDLLAGARYTRVGLELDVDIQFSPAVLPGGGLEADDSVSWTDGVVGVAVHHPLNEKWALDVYGDVGKGSDDSTWQYAIGASYEIDKSSRVRFGYRALSWDYEKDGVTWDNVQSGPYIGMGFKF
jgi:opacity protein-like surface antigen